MLPALRGCIVGDVLLMSTVDGEAPVRELDGLVDAVRWAQGVGAALGSGPLRTLAELGHAEKQHRGRQGEVWRDGARAADRLGRYADGLSSVNVPGILEVAGGRELSPPQDDRGRVLAEIFERALSLLPQLRDPVDDHARLEAELAIAERYLAWMDPLRAGLVLREWMVNRVLAGLGVAHHEWSDRERRGPAEGLLHAASPDSLPARLWSEVGQRRNPMAHAGFSTQAHDKAGLGSLQRRLEIWAEVVRRCRGSLDALGSEDDPFRLALLDHHVLLIGLDSPSPRLDLAQAAAEADGSLDRTVVVTSSAVARTLAGREGVSYATMTDLVRPPGDLGAAMDGIFKHNVHGAARVTACLTGSSTLLDMVIGHLADLASRAGADVTRLILDPAGQAWPLRW